MSEEKLYAIKNDEGKYWDFYSSGFWKPDSIDCIATPIKKQAELVIKYYGGHIVTFIEEPEKVVLTKKRAKIVENARASDIPATYISGKTDAYSGEESQLMSAYVNGYTVEKEKKYCVKVPKKWSGDDKHYWTKEQDGALTWACLINKDYMIPAQQLTEAEIEHYGLQDCEKIWCDSDD